MSFYEEKNRRNSIRSDQIQFFSGIWHEKSLKTLFTIEKRNKIVATSKPRE